MYGLFTSREAQTASAAKTDAATKDKMYMLKENTVLLAHPSVEKGRQRLPRPQRLCRMSRNRHVYIKGRKVISTLWTDSLALGSEIWIGPHT